LTARRETGGQKFPWMGPEEILSASRRDARPAKKRGGLKKDKKRPLSFGGKGGKFASICGEAA